MWPVILGTLRTYAPYITLPFAGLVGVIGYNLENWLSDKYTPYNSKYMGNFFSIKFGHFCLSYGLNKYCDNGVKSLLRILTVSAFKTFPFVPESIKEQRQDRLMEEEKLATAENVEKLRYKANVLDKNVSPSLN